MPLNVQTMAYYGEVPWHKRGNLDIQLPPGITEEMNPETAHAND